MCVCVYWVKSEKEGNWYGRKKRKGLGGLLSTSPGWQPSAHAGLTYTTVTTCPDVGLVSCGLCIVFV